MSGRSPVRRVPIEAGQVMVASSASDCQGVHAFVAQAAVIVIPSNVSPADVEHPIHCRDFPLKDLARAGNINVRL